jgi:hypothetical protein
MRAPVSNVTVEQTVDLVTRTRLSAVELAARTERTRAQRQSTANERWQWLAAPGPAAAAVVVPAPMVVFPHPPAAATRVRLTAPPVPVPVQVPPTMHVSGRTRPPRPVVLDLVGHDDTRHASASASTRAEMAVVDAPVPMPAPGGAAPVGAGVKRRLSQVDVSYAYLCRPRSRHTCCMCLVRSVRRCHCLYMLTPLCLCVRPAV